MYLKLPYGKDFQIANLKGVEGVNILQTQRHLLPAVRKEELKTCIANSLRDIKVGDTVSIAVPDHTRPNIVKFVLPQIAEQLAKEGVREVRIYVGTGLHCPPTSAYLEELVPRRLKEYFAIQVLVHDARNKEKLAFLGKTSLGTPVWIMKEYLEAKTKIAISIVEAHQFAGFSGGAKAVAIGLAGESTINENHAKLVHPNARIGVLQGNPIREEIDEIGRMVGIDFLVNVVLNDKGYPAKLFCGAHPRSHVAACDFIKYVSGVPVQFLYDAVIVSPGGYPRDIDLYQAQKALAVAEVFCKAGGTIVLVAECPAGYGDDAYVKLLKGADSPETLMQNFSFSHFKVGPHKAYLLARTLSRYNVRIVSKLPADELRDLFFEPYTTLEDALNGLRKSERVLAIPNASQIVPVIY